MTPKEKGKAHREFWLADVTTADHGEILVAFVHHKNIKGSIHVIEYAALLEAKAEIAELEIANAKLGHHFENCHADKIVTLNLEIQSLKNRLAVAVEALESRMMGHSDLCGVEHHETNEPYKCTRCDTLSKLRDEEKMK